MEGYKSLSVVDIFSVWSMTAFISGASFDLIGFPIPFIIGAIIGIAVVCILISRSH